jgi:peptidoglycan/LPS O-acetylase OafA/YrhL
MPLIDALKGIAAQVIVLHHLVSYGPLAEMMNRLLPSFSGWLFDYGRMAVQVFLVIAGFLAAKGMAASGVPVVANPGALIWRRYVRLVRPFLAAMLLAIACAAIARLWMNDEAIPDAPGLWQFVAHGLLLHGVFDVPSLSVGIWYVAVDFQLYVLMLCLLWLASFVARTEAHQRALVQILVTFLGMLALFYFNLNADLDDWAIYFFGSYALGAMAYWLSEEGKRGINPGMVLLALIGMAALVFEYRTRIALALIVALVLGYARLSGLLVRWPKSRLLAYLGQISYSVFLVHFPVCLVVNAVFERFTSNSPLAGTVAMLAAWGGSTLAGGIFYRLVENRKQWWPVSTASSRA